MKQLCWRRPGFPHRPLSPTHLLCRSAILLGPLQAQESPACESRRTATASSSSSFSALVVSDTISCRIQTDSSTPFLSCREWRHAEEALQSRKSCQREAKRVVRWHERLHADRCQSLCRLPATDCVRRAVLGCGTAPGKTSALELNVPFQLITPILKKEHFVTSYFTSAWPLC